jgi:hypothetical protein
MLIDTQAHLDYPDFPADFNDVLSRGTKAGVTRIITIGTSVESSRRALLRRHCLRDSTSGEVTNHGRLPPIGSALIRKYLCCRCSDRAR